MANGSLKGTKVILRSANIVELVMMVVGLQRLRLWGRSEPVEAIAPSYFVGQIPAGAAGNLH